MMTYEVLKANVSVPAGDQITNTTTETTFTSQIYMAANTDVLANGGKTYLLKGFLAYGTVVTAPGTLTLKIKLGSTVLAATNAIALPVVAQTNAGGWFEILIRYAVTGTSGLVICQGFGMLDTAANAPVSFSFVNPGTLVSGQITVNTQTQQNLLMTATFSVANAANKVTLTEFFVERVS